MRALVGGASVVLGALLLATVAAVAPAPVKAACGGGFDDGYLARYAGRHADTIVMGRLIEVDGDGNYHFTVLDAYRGGAASPIVNGWPESLGIIDVGGCTGQALEPGGSFIYASGDHNRRGPMQLIFPHVPDRGWLIEHFGGYRSLNGLLALLGVLPDTSTGDSMEEARNGFAPELGAVLPALFAFAWVFFGLSSTRQPKPHRPT